MEIALVHTATRNLLAEWQFWATFCRGLTDIFINKTGIAPTAVARPNGQPRQAGVARGVRGHDPPPPEKF